MSSFYIRPDGQLLGRVAALLQGRSPIRVGARYGLDQAGAALDAAVQGRAGGAVVLEPNGAG